MDATRASLEAALVDRPDDVATHCAYADYLAEQGDPRGEYIQLAIAAENRDQPHARLRALDQQMFELRQRHETEWLGPLNEFVNPPRAGRSVAEPESPNVEVTFKRGWLNTLHIGTLTPAIVEAVAGCPIAALTRRLGVSENRAADGGGVSIEAWRRGRFGGGLRSLTLGESDCGHAVTSWTFGPPEEVRRWLRGLHQLETLAVTVESWTDRYTLEDRVTRLEMRLALESLAGPAGESLREFAITATNMRTWPEFPIAPLALNNDFVSRFPRLTRLGVHTPGDGDRVSEVLCSSELLSQLLVLDLRWCGLTDEGAVTLAQHPAVPRVHMLYLDDNLISPAGIEALAAVGVAVSQRQLLGPLGGYPPDDDELVY